VKNHWEPSFTDNLRIYILVFLFLSKFVSKLIALQISEKPYESSLLSVCCTKQIDLISVDIPYTFSAAFSSSFRCETCNNEDDMEMHLMINMVTYVIRLFCGINYIVLY
jgi:hypothetical protein